MRRCHHTPPSTIKFQINSIYFIFFILFVRFILFYTFYFFFFSHVSMLVSLSLSLSTQLPPHFALKLFVVITKLQQIHIYSLTYLVIFLLWLCLALCSCWWTRKKKFYARRERNRKRLWDVSHERENPRFTQTTNIANRSCSCLFFPFLSYATNELREKGKKWARESEREKIFHCMREEGAEKYTGNIFFCMLCCCCRYIHGGELEHQPASCCTTRESS